eukprot:5318734-Amphidinium_carterae.1
MKNALPCIFQPAHAWWLYVMWNIGGKSVHAALNQSTVCLRPGPYHMAKRRNKSTHQKGQPYFLPARLELSISKLRRAIAS